MTVCCPMVVATMGPELGYTPLPITSMKIDAQCQISVGFVKVELECYYPQVRPSPCKCARVRARPRPTGTPAGCTQRERHVWQGNPLTT